MDKELDFNKYLMILQTKIDYSSGNTDCMLFDKSFSVLRSRSGKAVVEYGRQKVTFTNGNSKYMTAHRAMYMCIKEISFIPRNYELCHNSLCLRPDHRTMEPHSINMERLRCTHTIPLICLGHGNYPDCKLQVHSFIIFNW